MPQHDLHANWKPNPEQIANAVAYLKHTASGADTVVVPLALPGKQRGWWEIGQQVEPAPGYFPASTNAEDGPLEYHAATYAADKAAAEHLGDRPGQSSYATISADGIWHVWEGICASLAQRAKADLATRAKELNL